METTIDLELDAVLPSARFSERHERLVDRPIEAVWSAVLDVTAAEVRTLGPLMAMRSLPQLVRGRAGRSSVDRKPLLDMFTGEGFLLLRRDKGPRDGRAVVLFGAAGKFWSLTGNSPVALTSTAELLAFSEPGHAKTVASIEATSRGDRTLLITETRVIGTDVAAARRFGAYWALIRLPSGLIRRSWLAAIDRRSRRG